MAIYSTDWSVTIPDAAATLVVVTAGHFVRAGLCIYIDPATGKAKVCSNSSGDSNFEARVVGMSVNEAYLDQPLVYVTSGIVNLEPVIKNGGLFDGAGVMLRIHGTGAMSDSAPSVGDWMSWIGYTLDDDRLMVLPKYSDVQYFGY